MTNEAFERLACAGDGIAIERLECGTSLDKRPIRRGPHVDRDIQLARLRAFDRCDEAVALPDFGLDVWRAVVLVAERFSQALDGLRNAVVADGDVTPASLTQRVFGDDVPGVRRQQEEKLQVAIGKRDRLTSAAESSAA